MAVAQRAHGLAAVAQSPNTSALTGPTMGATVSTCTPTPTGTAPAPTGTASPLDTSTVPPSDGTATAPGGTGTPPPTNHRAGAAHRDDRTDPGRLRHRHRAPDADGLRDRDTRPLRPHPDGYRDGDRHGASYRAPHGEADAHSGDIRAPGARVARSEDYGAHDAAHRHAASAHEDRHAARHDHGHSGHDAPGDGHPRRRLHRHPGATETDTSTPAATDTTTDTPTPTPKPILIALGDSVTSGHHQGWCDAHYDRTYSYPYKVWQRLGGHRKWDYDNQAHSGFTTSGVIGDDETNACGQGPFNHPSPLQQAVGDLTAHRGAGNKVVITAGANNTNWVPMLVNMALKPAPVRGMTSAKCDKYIAAKWDGPTHIGDIEQGAKIIVDRLGAADHGARHVTIYWINYYNMAGTARVGRHEVLPRVCEHAINGALASLQLWIQTGYGRSKYGRYVQWINVNRRGILYMQNVQRFALTPMPVGWPHPDGAGHSGIASQIP